MIPSVLTTLNLFKRKKKTINPRRKRRICLLAMKARWIAFRKTFPFQIVRARMKTLIINSQRVWTVRNSMDPAIVVKKMVRSNKLNRKKKIKIRNSKRNKIQMQKLKLNKSLMIKKRINNQRLIKMTLWGLSLILLKSI